MRKEEKKRYERLERNFFSPEEAKLAKRREKKKLPIPKTSFEKTWQSCQVAF